MSTLRWLWRAITHNPAKDITREHRMQMAEDRAVRDLTTTSSDVSAPSAPGGDDAHVA